MATPIRPTDVDPRAAPGAMDASVQDPVLIDRLVTTGVSEALRTGRFDMSTPEGASDLSLVMAGVLPSTELLDEVERRPGEHPTHPPIPMRRFQYQEVDGQQVVLLKPDGSPDFEEYKYYPTPLQASLMGLMASHGIRYRPYNEFIQDPEFYGADHDTELDERSLQVGYNFMSYALGMLYNSDYRTTPTGQMPKPINFVFPKAHFAIEESLRDEITHGIGTMVGVNITDMLDGQIESGKKIKYTISRQLAASFNEANKASNKRIAEGDVADTNVYQAVLPSRLSATPLVYTEYEIELGEAIEIGPNDLKGLTYKQYPAAIRIIELAPYSPKGNPSHAEMDLPLGVLLAERRGFLGVQSPLHYEGAENIKGVPPEELNISAIYASLLMEKVSPLWAPEPSTVVVKHQPGHSDYSENVFEQFMVDFGRVVGSDLRAYVLDNLPNQEVQTKKMEQPIIDTMARNGIEVDPEAELEYREQNIILNGQQNLGPNTRPVGMVIRAYPNRTLGIEGEGVDPDAPNYVIFYKPIQTKQPAPSTTDESDA